MEYVREHAAIKKKHTTITFPFFVLHEVHAGTRPPSDSTRRGVPGTTKTDRHPFPGGRPPK